MADLSSLTDEQLQVYKDLLISKSNPSNSIPASKPPVPTGLVGPPPGRLETAVNNLPSSLLNAVRHPSFPGMPVDAPQGEGELGPTPEKIGRELSSFGHSITHPEEDPVGTMLTLAGMGRGIAKRGTGGMSVSNPVTREVGMASPESAMEVAGGAARGAGKGATSMVDISRYGHKLSVPAPVAGAAMGGLAAWPFEHIPVVGKYVPPIAAGLGAGAPVVKGAIGGAREAMDRIASRGQEPRPPGPSVPPQPEGQAPGPVGPLGKPTLPSGRKVGAMGPETPQAGPVSAPGGVGPGNPAAPPGTSDVQTTQAAEFATPESKVPRPGPVASPVETPQTPAPQQVQDPRLNRSSIQKHLEGISRKTENVKAFVSDPANQVTVEELESLRNDLTQAEDPAKYHSAIQKAKTMGKEVYVHAKGKGASIPDSPYKTFSLDDIDTAIKALQSQK